MADEPRPRKWNKHTRAEQQKTPLKDDGLTLERSAHSKHKLVILKAKKRYPNNYDE